MMTTKALQIFGGLLAIGLTATWVSFVSLAVAQEAANLSQLAVTNDVVGDPWNGSGGPDTAQDAARLFGPPNPIASYSVGFVDRPAQSGQFPNRVIVHLVAYADPQTALDSRGFVDPEFYWGHGNTTFTDVTGEYGDGPAYAAGGVLGEGVTFIDGGIVVYVQFVNRNLSDTDANAILNQLANAQDSQLQSGGVRSHTAAPRTAGPQTTSAPNATAAPPAEPSELTGTISTDDQNTPGQ